MPFLYNCRRAGLDLRIPLLRAEDGGSGFQEVQRLRLGDESRLVRVRRRVMEKDRGWEVQIVSPLRGGAGFWGGSLRTTVIL